MYFIAAALLFMVFVEQSDSELERAPLPSRSSDKLYRLAVSLGVFGFVAGLMFLVRRLVSVSEIYFFVVPGTVLGWVLLKRATKASSLRTKGRAARLLELALPFSAGAAIPTVAFFARYFVTHSFAAFYKGVFVVPLIRVAEAKFPPPSPGDFIALVPLLTIVAISWYSKYRDTLALSSLVFVICAAVLYYSPDNRIVFQFAFKSLSTSMPVAIVLGAWALMRGSSGIDALGRQRISLILSVVALCSLIQFPYSSPTYFCYVFPLLALAFLAVFAAGRPAPRVVPAVLVTFYTAFCCLCVTPVFALDGMAGGYYVPPPAVPMQTARAGGLSVAFPDATQYDALIAFVIAKSNGHAMFAGPDSLEVYFLAGAQNPTRTIFEFLDGSSTETERVLAAIEQSRVSLIVINLAPKVSGQYPRDLISLLKQRFPNEKDVGKFEVCWNDALGARKN